MSRALPVLALLGALATPSAAGEIRGRALAEGKPAAGVTVAAIPFEDGFAAASREARHEDLPKAVATATARADGTFSLAVAGAAGTVVRLAFSGGAVAPFVLEGLYDVAGEDAGDVRLPRAAALAGRVLDERGGPVVGATVTLWAGAGRGPIDRLTGSSIPQTATTKADGTFRFEAASDEGNRLLVEAPAFAATWRAGLRSGAVLRPIVLTLGRIIRGTVTLPDRRTAAAGALVRFEGRMTTTRWVETRTDGSFLLEGVPREAGSLVADAGERGRGVSPVAAGASEPVTVALVPTASLSGRVVDADGGGPLSGVRLLLRGEGGTSLGRSGRDGRFVFRGLAPQSFRLTADDERFVAWTRTVAVAAGESAAQDVPLVRGATLVGRVMSEQGTPVEGALIQVTRSGEGRFRAFLRTLEGGGGTRSGRDGTFRATRLAPGENQRLDVSHEDFEERTIGGLSLEAGATRAGVTVVLRRGLSVRGLVKDEEGRPLAGAEVTLTRAREFRGGRGGVTLSLIGPGSQVRRETGADGRFEFRGLKAGDYTVSARRTGFSRVTVDPVKVGEEAAEPLQLVLKPGVTISGVVRDRTGGGAAGWYVSARGASEGGGPAVGPGANRTEEPTGADGVFVLEGLVADESYDLQAMGPSGLGPRKAGVVAPAEGLELTVTGAGQIQGRVVDAESGRAIPDFQVSYQPDAQGGMRFVMRAGSGRGRGPYEKQPFHSEDGSFVLEEVAAGRWTVEAFAPGYQSGSASGVTVGEGEAAEGVEVRLSKGGTISGRVLESRTGRPILDASVRAEVSGGDAMRVGIRLGGEQEENSASTDADGRYEITGLAPGTYTVTASHPEWSEASTSVELKDTPATADVRLGRGGSIGGTVLAGGRPVTGADVSLQVAGDTGFRPGSFMSGGDQSALSDGAGRFRFDRLNPGRYTLVASMRDQTSTPVEAVLTGEDTQEIQLVLTEGAVVRGVVTGLPDVQLSGLTVSAQGRDYFSTTRTAAGGSFEFAGVPEGVLNLGATAGDFMSGSRSASTTVTIGPGQAEAAAEIVFEEGFRVDGHVTRGGQPVTQAMVTAFPDGGGRRTANARTDETGSFVLEGLQEGRYTITASSLTGGSPIRRTVDLVGDTTVDLEAPPARLAGTVVEAESGRSLGEVQVRLEGDEGGGRRFATMASTDSAGRFSFEDLEPRSYRVSFQKPAYQVETRDLAAAEESDVRVEMKRGEGIAIEARDGLFGTPLRGLFVRATDGSGNAVFAGSVSLDSDGRGEVPSLRPGMYEVRAESSGYAPVSRPGVAVPSPTVTLVLTPGGSLEIQVGPQTLALPQATARLIGADGRVYMWNAFTTDGKIRLSGPVRRIENVAPGAYVLEVEGGVRRELQIQEGLPSVVALP